MKRIKKIIEKFDKENKEKDGRSIQGNIRWKNKEVWYIERDMYSYSVRNVNTKYAYKRYRQGKICFIQAEYTRDMKKISRVERMTVAKIPIDKFDMSILQIDDVYKNYLSEEKLEKVRQVFEKPGNFEIRNVGKYLSPYRFNRYVVLYTNKGAHILDFDKKYIYIESIEIE